MGPDFQADSLLAVGKRAASSHATKDKRKNFQADALLAVGEKADSSYAI